MIEIKNRWNGSVVFRSETAETVAQAVAELIAQARERNEIADLSDADLRAANLSGADLRAADLRDADLRAADLSAANLRGADLRAANLRAADLSDADLRDADLRAANLRGADLRDADLRAADLSDADLRDADLRAANLRGADLRAADLSAANLRGADLRDANLRGADLRATRADFYDVLSFTPSEVRGLIAAIKAGTVDGSTYAGDCACLIGTVANLRQCSYEHLPGLKPDASRPIERFFLSIKKGDTPENNQHSAIVLQWAEDWLARMQAAFAASEQQ